MSKITFDQLPESIYQLHLKIDELKNLLFEKSNTNQPSDQLLNIDEAASFLNLSVSTVYSKVAKRELPFMKKSKRLYFSREDLHDYIIQGRKYTKEELQGFNQLKK